MKLTLWEYVLLKLSLFALAGILFREIIKIIGGEYDKLEERFDAGTSGRDREATEGGGGVGVAAEREEDRGDLG
jgi:hypothetical protein